MWYKIIIAYLPTGTGDNPKAKARGLSLRTDGQAIIITYLACGSPICPQSAIQFYMSSTNILSPYFLLDFLLLLSTLLEEMEK